MLGMSNTTPASTIDQRIRRLEVQNRFLIAGLALLLGALLVAATGKDAVPDVVKARVFHVVGRAGTPLVKIENSYGMGLGPGTVTTLNGKGQELVKLAVRTDGPDAVVT